MIKTLVMLLIPLYLHSFSTTNIQYLYGNFNGNSGFDTVNGGKSTVTLEHFTAYQYGDIFAFIDIGVADDVFRSDKSSDIYFEISPRFSFSKLVKKDFTFLFVKDIFIAFQYNRQVHTFEDYEAKLYGIGSDLKMKGFDIFGCNLYNKKQNFGDDTYQLSFNYTSNNIFNTKITFDGFTDWTKGDLLSQNKLLYKLNSTIFVGTEWHYYKLKDTNTKSNVLQAIVMYKW
nr:outer membrane protein OmpK [Sulfurimonas sp. SAG-AH-194-I05]